MDKHVEERVATLATPVAEALGLEVLRVEYRTGRGATVLRVVIDKPGGVGVDDCAHLSEQLSPLLDVEDLIPTAYHLEVSSPGLDWPLQTPRDFRVCRGRLVRVQTRTPVEGRCEFLGRIAQVSEDAVTLRAVEGDATWTVPLAAIAQARQEIQWKAGGSARGRKGARRHES